MGVNLRPGTLARLVFSDHTFQSRDLTKCEVCGRIVSYDADKVVVSVWTVLSGDVDFIATNNECVSIATGTIILQEVMRRCD